MSCGQARSSHRPRCLTGRGSSSLRMKENAMRRTSSALLAWLLVLTICTLLGWACTRTGEASEPQSWWVTPIRYDGVLRAVIVHHVSGGCYLLNTDGGIEPLNITVCQ